MLIVIVLFQLHVVLSDASLHQSLGTLSNNLLSILMGEWIINCRLCNSIFHKPLVNRTPQIPKDFKRLFVIPPSRRYLPEQLPDPPCGQMPEAHSTLQYHAEGDP